MKPSPTQIWIAPWLRREGLYGAQLANWRKTLKEQGEQGLEPKSGGRKPKDPRERRIEELERENTRLQKRLHSAEKCLSLQKKLLTLVEEAQDSENSR